MPLVQEFQYCLTIIDRFSRWPAAVPLKDTKANTVAKALIDHWICLYGTPLKITSDQGMQFESALFASLAQLTGAKQIHTTPYHPQSNGIVERFHRTLKAALMCGAPASWLDRLPTTLLGLRMAFKKDLQASPAEMLYGTTLRVPGEFFVATDNPADSTSFASKLRSLFQIIRPVPASRHTLHQPFTFEDLNTCSHVFRRVDTVRKPLEPPYSGPHRVMKRINSKSFVILVDGAEKTVSTDSLKPAYSEQGYSEPPPRLQSSPSLRQTQSSPAPQPTQPPPVTKRVSFSLPPGKVTRGGVDVGPPTKAGLPSRSLPCDQSPPRVDRRKQVLQPRRLNGMDDGTRL